MHSLSKQSNAAGYRGGLLSGDPALVRRVWEVRRHLGLLVPGPGAGGDGRGAGRRRARRGPAGALPGPPRPAGRGRAGGRCRGSTTPRPGLYLWVTRDEDCWTTIDWLAGLGIVAAPGSFYGPAGARHVRMALTATDERIATAVERLTS